MNNVFDLVADFYGQDEEWNTVLRQSYVENFLRAKSWQGASDEELTEAWDHITLLCLYLGNSENFLGDMSRDDFIDCIANNKASTINPAESTLETMKIALAEKKSADTRKPVEL